MTFKLDTLQAALQAVLADTLGEGRKGRLVRDLGEITVTVPAADYLQVARALRDDPSLRFEQLIDLCGVDYADYRNQAWDGPRFSVVVHVLSVTHNWRVRLKTFAPDDDVPAVASVNEIWSSANWFEREAFDLYGIIFEVISTCAGSSPTTVSSVTPCARTSPPPATWRCATTPRRNASSTSR